MCLDAVGQPAQARAVLGRGTPYAVVLDLDHQPPVVAQGADRRLRRVRVLDDVRERLAGDEVRRRLDVGRGRSWVAATDTGIGTLAASDSRAGKDPPA